MVDWWPMDGHAPGDGDLGEPEPEADLPVPERCTPSQPCAHCVERLAERRGDCTSCMHPGHPKSKCNYGCTDYTEA